MKNSILTASMFLTIILLAFSSCTKEETETCYECTNANLQGCVVEICNRTATLNSSCGGASGSGNGLSNEEMKDTYVASGYTCTAQ